MPDLQDIFKSIRLKSLSPSQAKAFNLIRFVERLPLVPMLKFARTVVLWMFRLIPVVTDIALNANILSSRNGLRPRCPSFYRLVTSMSFLQSLRN